MDARDPLREELANTLTHGVGLIASVCGGAVLITLAAKMGDSWQLAGAIVYSLSMLLLYTASTLYHSSREIVVKTRLKVFDHCAIYILIAGTYTPVTLISLRGPVGWILFGVVWALALTGIVFKLFHTGRFKGVSTILYIAMGWLALFAIKPVVHALSAAALAWLLAGGVAYTLGTVFYLNRRIRYSHAIWHVFVLLGSVSHFISISLQVLQRPLG
jgi:hemolysin III